MSQQQPKFIRFVVLRNHENTGSREGPFGAAYELRDAEETPWYVVNRLIELLEWFEKNLKTPDRFNKSKSKGFYWRKATGGLSWFKEEADEHISRMRELTIILAEYGYLTELSHTERPGYIVYDDDFQIVAEPFSDRFTR